MKGLKWAAVLLAAGCIGVAGWRLRDFSLERREREEPVVAARPDRRPSEWQQFSAGGPVTKPASFLLTAAPPQPVPTLTDADWRRAYPAFRHAPYETSGFAAVALPWRYAATPDAGADDPAVARAMAFLLHYDLRWSPAARPVPPPFFVFRQSGELPAEAAAEAYDAKAVAALVERWRGTHAVGGVLVRGKDGYVATLQIFDRAGKPVHEAAFDKPQDLFPLLGDVSCDALRFFGTPANEALSARLHEARCKRPESLSLLGKASLARDRSAAELALYEQILKADPGFAEVRLWRGTQRLAADRDAEAYAAEQAEVLQASAHVAALADFVPEAASADAGRRLPRWIASAEALAGKDHPVVIHWRLRQARTLGVNRSPVDRETFAGFVRVAARYPNDWDLTSALIDAHGQQDHLDYRSTVVNATQYDPELVASMALAGVLDPAAEGQRGHAWLWVARAALALGRPHHALAAIARYDASPGDTGEAPGVPGRDQWEAQALMQMGQFAAAADAFERVASSSGLDEAAKHAAVCAVLAGRPDVIDRLAITPQSSDSKYFKACSAYLAGKVVAKSEFGNSLPGPEDLLLAEGELAAGGFSPETLPGTWARWVEHGSMGMEDPLRWRLLERYYRAVPTLPYAAAFYEAAEWERPNDPAVAEAVTRWRKAGGGDRTLATVEALIENLEKKQWRPNERMPDWAVVARVRRDVEEGRGADAARLAKAFLARGGRSNPARETWLVRKVEAAAPAGTTAPATRP